MRWVGGAVILIAVGALWFFFSGGSTQQPASTTGSSFGSGSGVSVTNTPDSAVGGNNLPQSDGQIIFKIANGPIAGATFIETSRPTTTVARYMMQESGHVLDLAVDTPGAIPKPISNTTIPGITRVVWLEQGNALIAQYIDGLTVKTAYLGFPVSTTTATSSAKKPTKIQFLPNNIADLAASPDGKNVAYLVRAGGGTDGYTARSDGSGSKKLFSFPLSQTLISWPSPNTLLLQTKSGAGVPGGAFSVNTQTGAVTPLVYAEGLTASANSSFSQILYQTVREDSGPRFTYVHDVKTGKDTGLSFDPFPERCLWSMSTTTTAVCATPLQYVAPNFLNLWHRGVVAASDSIVSFNLLSNKSEIIASPGSSAGGVASDIAEMALSPSEKYLSFITRGDRGLWGVRLPQ